MDIIGILIFQILLHVYIRAGAAGCERRWMLMPESVFCEDVLPVDGGERPLGPGFGPVWLGLACHVYVCGKTQNGETNPLSVIRA